MTDYHTANRQQWLQGLQKPVARCYQRNADGSNVMQYTHSKDMDADYLRRKFEQIRNQ